MPKLTKYIIAIAATAAIVFLVWYLGNVVAYILISAVLAIVGKPMVDALRKVKIRGKQLPRWVAALLALATMWAVGVIFLIIFIPLVLDKVNELAALDFNQIISSFDAPLSSLQDTFAGLIPEDSEQFSISEEIRKGFIEFFNLDVINSALSATVATVANLAVALFSITFITFFFLKEENLFQNMVITMFPSKYEQNIRHALDSITKLLIRYFTGILAESTIIMLLLSGIFLLWGFPVETALFMGIIMGVLNVIPYIGPIIGAGICVIIGIVAPFEWASITQMTLIIGGSILGVKMLDDFVLQPVLYSNRVKAHPLEIFIVILIAGNVAGVLGMLLAIPSYNVIRVLAKEFFNNFKLVQKLTENI